MTAPSQHAGKVSTQHVRDEHMHLDILMNTGWGVCV